MMRTPADRTAKHLSIEEWYARYDSLDLLPHHRAPAPSGRPGRAMPAPADRVATRT
ncbi:hypothetical protein [Terricaulis sp.]|uniref:hypothetical protein n=1 Tax=Terricaulis sp. TaxID=2768686 RepID=UPI0037831D58